MTPLPPGVNPAVARSLAHWHDMIARMDLSDLGRIVHPDAVFRSPMAVHPYGPAPALLMALQTVATILKDFSYHRQLASAGGPGGGAARAGSRDRGAGRAALHS